MWAQVSANFVYQSGSGVRMELGMTWTSQLLPLHECQGQVLEQESTTLHSRLFFTPCRKALQETWGIVSIPSCLHLDPNILTS